MAKRIRITLAGGGTAGHMNPLLAIGVELKLIAQASQTDLEVSYMGDPGKFDAKFESNGVLVRKIYPSKLRRYADPQNILEGPKLIFGFMQALWHLFWIMPDIVFSKGGPGSLAVVLAARFYRIPVVIHESDATPGITTRIASRFADRIFLSFEVARELLPIGAQRFAEVTGNPLRRSLLSDIPDKSSSKKILGFDPDLPLVFIVGGSQGSDRINNLVLASLPDILNSGIQVLHQTGDGLFDKVKGSLGNYFASAEEMEAAGYRPIPSFEGDMKEAISASDLIVSRAGSSIFEFAAFGKPSILIPLPEAAQNHQLLNAKAYEKVGGCIMMEENAITVPGFINSLKSLIGDPGRLRAMSEKAKAFAKPDAASSIALKLIELAKF